MNNLFEVKRGYKIKQMANDKEFNICFPHEDMRRELTKFRGLKFKTANIVVVENATRSFGGKCYQSCCGGRYYQSFGGKCYQSCCGGRCYQ